jgi:hypothetical protein
MSTFVKIECPKLNGAMAGLAELASSSEKGALAAIARGMFSWGQTTRTTKIIPRTPKDVGNLRGTITATVNRAGNKATLSLFAGGPAAPYAVAVHEHLSESSPRSWKKAEASGHGVHWRTPGTGPKYMENPIREDLPKLPVEVGAEVEKALQRAIPK